jgi:hypothetical protein
MDLDISGPVIEKIFVAMGHYFIHFNDDTLYVYNNGVKIGLKTLRNKINIPIESLQSGIIDIFTIGNDIFVYSQDNKLYYCTDKIIKPMNNLNYQNENRKKNQPFYMSKSKTNYKQDFENRTFGSTEKLNYDWSPFNVPSIIPMPDDMMKRIYASLQFNSNMTESALMPSNDNILMTPKDLLATLMPSNDNNLMTYNMPLPESDPINYASPILAVDDKFDDKFNEFDDNVDDNDMNNANNDIVDADSVSVVSEDDFDMELDNQNILSIKNIESDLPVLINDIIETNVDPDNLESATDGIIVKQYMSNIQTITNDQFYGVLIIAQNEIFVTGSIGMFMSVPFDNIFKKIVLPFDVISISLQNQILIFELVDRIFFCNRGSDFMYYVNANSLDIDIKKILTDYYVFPLDVGIQCNHKTNNSYIQLNRYTIPICGLINPNQPNPSEYSVTSRYGAVITFKPELYYSMTFGSKMITDSTVKLILSKSTITDFMYYSGNQMIILCIQPNNDYDFERKVIDIRGKYIVLDVGLVTNYYICYDSATIVYSSENNINILSMNALENPSYIRSELNRWYSHLVLHDLGPVAKFTANDRNMVIYNEHEAILFKDYVSGLVTIKVIMNENVDIIDHSLLATPFDPYFESTIKIYVKQNESAFDQMMILFFTHQQMTKFNLHYKSGSNIISEGNGVQREFFGNAWTEFKDQYLIQPPNKFYTQLNIEKMNNLEPFELEIIGYALYYTLLQQIKLPFRLPLDLLYFIHATKWNREMLEYFAEIENSDAFLKIKPFRDDIEKFNQLETGHVNYISTLLSLIDFPPITELNSKERVRIYKSIKTGFYWDMMNTDENALFVTKIRSMNVATFDYMISDRVKIDREKLITTLRIITDDEFNDLILTYKQFVRDFIFSLTENELRIMLRNWTGSSNPDLNELILRVNKKIINSNVEVDYVISTCEKSLAIKVDLITDLNNPYVKQLFTFDVDSQMIN